MIAALGVMSLALPPYDTDPRTLAWAAAAAVVTMGFGVASWRRDTRTWLDPVGPWLSFVVIALLAAGTGGISSGLVPLVSLPIFWLALFGRRRDLWVAAGLVVLLFVGPAVLGHHGYATGDWRRALLWGTLALVIAPMVQRLVERWQREAQRLREASAQVNAILRGATLSAIISTDLAGTVRTFGVGAERLLHLDAAEVVGRRSLSSFHDARELAELAAELHVPAGFDLLAELARTGAHSRIWTYLRGDGDRIFVQLAVTEMRDERGRTVGYLGVAIDTTAAVEAAKERRLAQKRWQILVNHLPDVTVIVLDEDRIVKVVGGGAASRRTMSSMVGRRYDDFASADNAELTRSMILATADGRTVTEVQLDPDGGEHELVAAPLPSSGRGREVVILVRDVTEQRSRERALTHAKERAERLFEESPQGIAILSADRVVLQVNGALCATLGREPSELVGRTLSMFTAEWDPARVEAESAALMAGRDSSMPLVWTTRRSDGAEVQVALSSIRLLESDGSLESVLVNVVDVSARHAFEAELASLAEHDSLTGLMNRRRFYSELERHLDYGRRYGGTGALLLLDLDHFKPVNDTLGHAAGDELLASIGTVLRRGLRLSDSVGRFGGDEFVVLLARSDRAGADAAAQGIVNRVRALTRTLAGAASCVTTSVGVVLIDDPGASAPGLLAKADLMMYSAKRAGGDRYVVAGPDSTRSPATDLPGQRSE